MTYLLHIETATTVCSVSLSEGDRPVAFREINDGFTHAENLHLFILSILNESGVQPGQLGAIAVSRGPGSYTGLRIGLSAAKGLAFALGIPLIGIDTLQAMTQQVASTRKDDALYCPLLDARRMEVYLAVYDAELRQVEPACAFVVSETSIAKFIHQKRIYFFGDGMPKCRQLLERLPNAGFIDSVVPSSKDLSTLAWKKYQNKEFEDVAYFTPFYLKEFNSGPTAKD